VPLQAGAFRAPARHGIDPGMIESARTSIRLIGGPTALISYGGLRILTDATFDPPGAYPRPNSRVVLTKLTGPAVAPDELLPIDVVLVSHDHHADNLDAAGRAFLQRADMVLTTTVGAERLTGKAIGLEPEQTVDVPAPDGGVITMTAVAAEHGPPEVAAINGPVIGFVLRGDRLPTMYVSGDNAAVAVVERIARRHGPFDGAILFAGGAQVPVAYGDVLLTLDAQRAVEAAALLEPAVIIPIHQEGWAHFSSGPDKLRDAFAAAGLADRLRPLAPGEQVTL
jgi:L-ascorbate metabolism protein UlaG (beta-lactamase superfamily)